MKHKFSSLGMQACKANSIWSILPARCIIGRFPKTAPCYAGQNLNFNPIHCLGHTLNSFPSLENSPGKHPFQGQIKPQSRPTCALIPLKHFKPCSHFTNVKSAIVCEDVWDRAALKAACHDFQISQANERQTNFHKKTTEGAISKPQHTTYILSILNI